MDLLAAPDINGLFTDGNCTDLTVTFLEPAERQLFQANVVWREEEGNGFPKTKTTMVRLSPTQIILGFLEAIKTTTQSRYLTSAIQSPMRPTPFISPNMRYAHGRRLTTP